MEKIEKNILSDEEYRKIIENTSDLIVLVSFSIKPVYLYVSPSHERILGYSPDSLMGKSSFNFFHPEDKKRLLSLLRRYVSAKAKKLLLGKESENSEKIEFRIKDKNGSWHSLESTVDILGNKLLIISKDVTERKQVENEIRQRNLELEKANKLMIGRELKMVELKKRIKDLERALNHDKKNVL